MLRLYDTLSGEKKPFTPQDPALARVYVCGPTVYDYAHLGHARCYVVYDVLVRHLRHHGQPVKYVRNITDIDDKILKRAQENGEPPAALSERFTDAFQEDMRRIGNLDPDIEPKVSEHLDEITAMISTLIERGHAYESDGDVYFAVESFEDYGKLSHRDLEKNEAGASDRIDSDQAARKRHPADFALWKKSSDPSVDSWKSPWSEGRPGWHIECSAMSMAHLGETLDLHGGGLDLVFPHHENEIAQSECSSGKPFSHHWVHNGFVEVDKTKMSKSLGNFFTARELFDKIEPEAIRLFMMSVHYRSPLNLDWDLDEVGNVTGFPQIEEAERRLEYLYETQRKLATIPPARVLDGPGDAPQGLLGFAEALRGGLNDDLNMPIALAAMSELLATVNEACDRAMRKKGKIDRASIEAAERAFGALTAVLGLGGGDADAVLTRIRDRRAASVGITPEFVQQKIEERANARAEKEFERADGIRKELAERGVELHDSPEGTRWTMS